MSLLLWPLGLQQIPLSSNWHWNDEDTSNHLSLSSQFKVIKEPPPSPPATWSQVQYSHLNLNSTPSSSLFLNSSVTSVLRRPWWLAAPMCTHKLFILFPLIGKLEEIHPLYPTVFPLYGSEKTMTALYPCLTSLEVRVHSSHYQPFMIQNAALILLFYVCETFIGVHPPWRQRLFPGYFRFSITSNIWSLVNIQLLNKLITTKRVNK